MNLIEPQSPPPILTLLSLALVSHLTRPELPRNVEQIKYFIIAIVNFRLVGII